MASITIHFEDGTKKFLEDRGASGGSWHQSIRYEPGFVVITDAYGKQTAYPERIIKEIEVHSERRGW